MKKDITPQKSKREDLTDQERVFVDQLIKPYVNINTLHFGKTPRKIMRYDKRPQMYGGSGVVYLLQMFTEGELVNNRIGAYMVLPTSKDSVGFHTHGTRKEQELYVVLEGQGEYLEKADAQAQAQVFNIEKGNITSIKGSGYHGVRNTGDTPLIIFVITTNEPS